jgi:hypothetical protein
MQADMQWVLANMELLAAATNMDMAPPAYVEMVPTREHPVSLNIRPAAFLFTYSMPESLLDRNHTPSKRNLIVTFF